MICADMEGAEELFMTHTYSFENYLVNESVLEELLKNELHCHAEPICKKVCGNYFSSNTLIS